MTTLFERDTRFTTERIRELQSITDSERRARAMVEPRTGEAHPGTHPRPVLGPALTLALRSLRNA